jgi:hypothetical protein
MDGRHYDADVPDGVDSFFDLPLFRRNLAVLMLALHAELAASLDTSVPWWTETFRLGRELLEWKVRRSPVKMTTPEGLLDRVRLRFTKRITPTV